MNDTSDQPGAASDKRRDQARERQRRRSDLNRHYMEEAALSALDAGTLRDQEVALRFSALDMLSELGDWLGTDREVVMNQAICLAAGLVNDGRTSVQTLERLVNDPRIHPYTDNWVPVKFKPMAETVRAVIKAENRHALLIYGNAGLILLFESLRTARLNSEAVLSTFATNQ